MGAFQLLLRNAPRIAGTMVFWAIFKKPKLPVLISSGVVYPSGQPQCITPGPFLKRRFAFQEAIFAAFSSLFLLRILSLSRVMRLWASTVNPNWASPRSSVWPENRWRPRCVFMSASRRSTVQPRLRYLATTAVAALGDLPVHRFCRSLEGASATDDADETLLGLRLVAVTNRPSAPTATFLRSSRGPIDDARVHRSYVVMEHAAANSRHR